MHVRALDEQEQVGHVLLGDKENHDPRREERHDERQQQQPCDPCGDGQVRAFMPKF